MILSHCSLLLDVLCSHTDNLSTWKTDHPCLIMWKLRVSLAQSRYPQLCTFLAACHFINKFQAKIKLPEMNHYLSCPEHELSYKVSITCAIQAVLGHSWKIKFWKKEPPLSNTCMCQFLWLETKYAKAKDGCARFPFENVRFWTKFYPSYRKKMQLFCLCCLFSSI